MWNLRCVVTVEANPLDLVVEGRAAKVRHEDTLRRVADPYASIYDWHVTVRDDAFDYAAGRPSRAHLPMTSTK